MAEKETVNEENAAFAEAAESAAEEAAAKEDTEAVAEGAVGADEAVKEAEPEASAEAEGGEKAEQATLTEEAAFAEAAESAAEEAAAKEDTEAVAEGAVGADEAVKEAEPEASAEAEGEEKAKAEAEENAKAEGEEKTKAEAEEKAKAEAEEKAVTTDETEEQPVSETIRRIGRSPAELPGEPALPTTAEVPAVSDSGEFLAICAKDIMRKEVIWGSPDDSVQQTLTRMEQADVGYMMVGPDGALEGIVSKSDLTGAISPYLRQVFARWRRPLDDATLHIKVKWIMSRPVHTIKPETSLAAIMANMRQSGQRASPVVDQQGKVQGLVTVFDILEVLLNTNPDTSTAGKTPQASPLA